MTNVSENPYQDRGVPIMHDGRPAMRQNSAKSLVADNARTVYEIVRDMEQILKEIKNLLIERTER